MATFVLVSDTWQISRSPAIHHLIGGLFYGQEVMFETEGGKRFVVSVTNCGHPSDESDKDVWDVSGLIKRLWDPVARRELLQSDESPEINRAYTCRFSTQTRQGMFSIESYPKVN